MHAVTHTHIYTYIYTHIYEDMHTHAPGRSHGCREVQRKPEDIAGLCDVVRENPRTPRKALVALLNDQFASVRATADGRGGGYGGRPWGRARAAHPRGSGVCRCRS